MTNENEGVAFEDQGGDAATFDLSGVEDTGFDVLPKGVYNVAVDESEFRTSESSGNPMFSLTLVVTDGEYEGRKLFTHIVFAPKTLSMAKRTLRVLDPTSEIDLSQVRMDQETADLLVGKTARAKVSIEKYDGEDTNRVKKLMPGQEGSDDIFNAD